MTIRIPYNSGYQESGLMERHDRFGNKVSVTIRIPYNSSISRVWVNGETHDRHRETITTKFKKGLHKWQSVKQKNIENK